MIIKEIESTNIKQEIARTILKDLPLWFGIDESTQEYIDTVGDYKFIAAYIDNQVAGFYSIREENNDVLDMYVLGVLSKYHGSGIGSKLQKYVDKYAMENKYTYLMVLTLAEKAQNKEYLMTRKFYLKQGFTDFYQSDVIFDENNPCQIMIKKLY